MAPRILHAVAAAASWGRIAELKKALEERRQHANALAAHASEAPPTASELATALDRLPLS